MDKQYAYWGKASLMIVAFAWVVSLQTTKGYEEIQKESNPTISESRLKRFDKLKNMPQTPPNIEC